MLPSGSSSSSPAPSNACGPGFPTRLWNETDHDFHFAPFATLHDNAFSPIHTRQQFPATFTPFKNIQRDVQSSCEDPPPAGGDDELGFREIEPDKRASYLQYGVPTPCNSMEAYLLLEAARSNRQISRMRTDLAVEIVHRNTIALQFNRLVLERAQNDLRAADELVGYVRLSIRQSGHSAASQYAMQECNLPRRTATARASRSPALDVVLD